MQIVRCAALLLFLAASACAAPVRVANVGADEVYATVRSDELVDGTPSVAARLVLERADLADLWSQDPAAALVALHEMAVRADTRDRLYGLAELSLSQGRRTNDPQWYLGSAVYSFLYLFGKAEDPPPGPFDPRFRMACDFYERSVAEAFRGENGFEPAAGRRQLPVGAIEIAVPSPQLQVGDVLLDAFECANDYEVVGMRSRVRTEGLGVPLIAVHRAQADAGLQRILPGRVPPALRMPATALLSVDGELGDLAAGSVRGTLEVRTAFAGSTATVRGRAVPLTTDLTAPIAQTLGAGRMWTFERRAFLRRDAEDIQNGVILTTPYQKGKIPLLLVHGTASSPARWAELFNELAADRRIAERYQVWLFIYGTGSPILASAASLRSAIRDTVQALDPAGADPALRRMVVIGHSQGGLLTRLMATSSGDRFWRNFTDEPFESMDLRAEERETFRKAFFFEPVPEVARVVFISTPHRGSFVAGNFLGKMGAALISLPETLVDTMSDAVTRNLARVRGDAIGTMPTAVDNMKPGSPFVQALGDLPIDPRVKVNSIVSVDGDGPVEEGDDGVVSYESAHMPTAESELVVRSPHSCQGHPRTILEIRRILRMHAGGN